jgi:hypothetical protein
MKLGHLHSLRMHVRRHPPPVSRRARAYPVNETYNLHFLRACASRAVAHRVHHDVQHALSWTIITPSHPLSGINCG